MVEILPTTVQAGANIPAIKKYADKFAGQVVMVTGAAQGIGKVTATMFATQGATVILVDMNEGKLKTVAEELTSLLSKPNAAAAAAAAAATIATRTCDLSQEGEVTGLIDNVITTFHKIDVLVHLAGIYPFKPIVSHTTAEYSRVMAVNMDSCFHLTRAVLPHMQRAGYGRIINTASGSVLHPEPGLGVYAATKSAVVGLTRSTAVEAGPGVTANAVCPGLIFNESTWGNPGSRAVFERMLERQCVKRFGLPSDVAEMIGFIASPESEYITGQLFDISGGATFG